MRMIEAQTTAHYHDLLRWTPLIGQRLRKDKCFPQHERSAQERNNETETTDPFTRV